MTKDIKFGTSGWRGIIADDFTMERAAYVVGAIATYLEEKGESAAGVLVAHDPRFLGREFAAAAARQLAERGIDVYFADRPTPTPAASYLVLERKLGGAVNFTASHNPAQYQGLKFSPSWGGPAMPETTGRIEDLAGRYMRSGLPPAGPARGRIIEFDPVPEYTTGLRKIINFDLIRSSGLPLTFDALYGAGAGFLDVVLTEAGCPPDLLHTRADPTFGGGPPEPSEERLAELASQVSRRGGLGLSTDGDADRFGIIGSAGEFYQPNTILSLLADDVLGRRRMAGDLARSVATTHQLDAVAAAYGRRCHETPVGFKYIGQMIHRGELALGGEESAGMSIGGHIPEKDGILACLLVAEMVAAAGKGLNALKEDLDRRYGMVVTRRINITIDERIAAVMKEALRDPPREVRGHRARELVTLDGTKWLFEDGSWTLLRMSGTEPVARLYVEADSEERLHRLQEAFESWILEGNRPK